MRNAKRYAASSTFLRAMIHLRSCTGVFSQRRAYKKLCGDVQLRCCQRESFGSGLALWESCSDLLVKSRHPIPTGQTCVSMP